MAIPRSLVVYFSQGGANARVAEAIGAGLKRSGYDVDLWNLRNGRAPDPRSYQVFGVGSPIYYYHVPINVAYYINRLPRFDGIAGFVFIVHGTHRIDGANWLRRRLTRKGIREVGYFHCHGEAHVLPLLKEGYLFSPGHPLGSELQEATQFGELVAERAAGKPYTQDPYEPKPPFIYRLEKLLASRWLIEHYYSRLFRVDASKCTACGRCMEVCPTSNITRDAFDRPQWDRRCLECLSCEMTCPEEAISSALSRPFPGGLLRPFFRYNVHRWVREGELDYVRVVHQRGEIHRIGLTGTGPPV
jgi:ferredoxin/flavodoxin